MRRGVLALLFLFLVSACGDATGISKHVEEVSRWMFKDHSSGELLVFGPDPVTRLEVEKDATCERQSAHVVFLYGFPLQHEIWTCVWWG